jgi:cysteinyl-tRNA synthetase
MVPAVLERFRAIDLRYYMVAAHYRSHVEFSFEALAEAAAGFARIEHFLDRAAEVLGTVEVGNWNTEFERAMDDDLGTPAAVAALHDVVHEGNRLLPEGDSPALRKAASSVRAMLAVLGVDPLDPHWSAGAASAEQQRLTAAVDALVATLLEQRSAARAAKDFATADALRGQLKAAGVEIEDTPQGPRWTM